jgi:hypothetical protein
LNGHGYASVSHSMAQIEMKGYIHSGARTRAGGCPIVFAFFTKRVGVHESYARSASAAPQVPRYT